MLTLLISQAWLYAQSSALYPDKIEIDIEAATLRKGDSSGNAPLFKGTSNIIGELSPGDEAKVLYYYDKKSSSGVSLKLLITSGEHEGKLGWIYYPLNMDEDRIIVKDQNNLTHSVRIPFTEYFRGPSTSVIPRSRQLISGLTPATEITEYDAQTKTDDIWFGIHTGVYTIEQSPLYNDELILWGKKKVNNTNYIYSISIKKSLERLTLLKQMNPQDYKTLSLQDAHIDHEFNKVTFIQKLQVYDLSKNLEIAPKIDQEDMDKVWAGIHKGIILITQSLDNPSDLIAWGRTCEFDSCIYSFPIIKSLERLSYFQKLSGKNTISLTDAISDSSFDEESFLPYLDSCLVLKNVKLLNPQTKGNHFLSLKDEKSINSCYSKLKKIILSEGKGVLSQNRGMANYEQNFMSLIVTSIGEIGEYDRALEHYPTIMHTVYQRTHANKTDVSDEALRAWQFSLWNTSANAGNWGTKIKYDVGVSKDQNLKNKQIAIYKNTIRSFIAYAHPDFRAAIYNKEPVMKSGRVTNYVEKDSVITQYIAPQHISTKTKAFDEWISGSKIVEYYYFPKVEPFLKENKIVYENLGCPGLEAKINSIRISSGNWSSIQSFARQNGCPHIFLFRN